MGTSASSGYDGTAREKKISILSLTQSSSGGRRRGEDKNCLVKWLLLLLWLVVVAAVTMMNTKVLRLPSQVPTSGPAEKNRNPSVIRLRIAVIKSIRDPQRTTALG